MARIAAKSPHEVALAAEAKAFLDVGAFGLLALVLSRIVAGHRLVVPGERLVRGVGDARLQHCEVEDAEQCIAAADLVVEEAEREAGVYRLDPERDLGEFHGHRVAVHPVDATACRVAERMAEVGEGGRALGADASHACGNAPGRRQQEVTRAAGRVDHGEPEQGLGRILRLGLGPLQHRVEGGVKKRLNKAVRRVVGAGGLALVALLLGDIGGEDERAAVVRKLRLKLEEGFVHRAELLGLHRAPVDRHHGRFGL